MHPNLGNTGVPLKVDRRTAGEPLRCNSGTPIKQLWDSENFHQSAAATANPSRYALVVRLHYETELFHR